MASLDESITAIKEGAKEDRFTYLTILQYHVTRPEVLPALNEVLQDADLTSEIGWDLVQMLVDLEGSSACLETVARLGNPREVVIKVMESLDSLTESWSREAERAEDIQEIASTSKIPGKFITLCGMLSILHGRIKTKYPSRFLGPSLVKVFEAYQPLPEMTAAVINLVRSLSGRKRPPLPSRKSSINVLDPNKDGDSSKNAPDPEAESEDPTEEAMQQKLLQSFITCILQRFVNAHPMRWTPRLTDVYQPERRIPGRKTTVEAYSENETLQKRDGVVGQLVALLSDLGLNKCPNDFVRSIYQHSTAVDPLAAFDDFSSPEDIQLSPGGVVCLIAYWLFASAVFQAHQPECELYIFPEHLALLERFLGQDAEAEITSAPGTADALLAIGVALEQKDRITEQEEPSIMAYHHHLTLISVFHPDIAIRSAATNFAGVILHSDPDQQNRLEILEDLLENCMFASLKACALTWLKEEIIAATKEGPSGNTESTTSPPSSSSLFASPEVIDRLQYAIFPDMISALVPGGGNLTAEGGLTGLDTDGAATSVVDRTLEITAGGNDDDDLTLAVIMDYWVQNRPFILQAANFAYFLLAAGSDTSTTSSKTPAAGAPPQARVVPDGMAAAVEQRFAEPLIGAAQKLQQSAAKFGLGGEEEMELSILVDRLQSLTRR
ncbi:uncharacterized protein B0I36DRAFT_381338 [Microdochium trichocladiopsis]|uniref:YAP-binding/ALF4/Glomulin n=1 Tax=Microdochium trichocladiopsis TaxID=1682393 RepID=A0A9P9BVA1_9PEZI|nr:uncharacterized protein B0I36DRAFT_381338 [Microdochium trichocladiopsis]KAH7038294.1 hypothetical protein B0I36DRAFT_381338 [Microdochium trichocladiopsis]